MARCFLTGVEIGLDNAFVLNRTVLYRLLRGLKDKTETLERLVEQLGAHDEVIVRQAPGQPPVTKKRRRLVSKAVAEVLRSGFGEPDLFIPFTIFANRSQGRPLSHLTDHPVFGASVSSASNIQLEDAVRLAREIRRKIDPRESLSEEIVTILQGGVCLVLSHRDVDEAVRTIAAALGSDESSVAIGVPAPLAGRFRAAMVPLFAALAAPAEQGDIAQVTPQALPES